MRTLSNTESELKKSVAYKKTCGQVAIPSIVGHPYMYGKHYMPCLKIKNIRSEKEMHTE